MAQQYTTLGVWKCATGISSTHLSLTSEISKLDKKKTFSILLFYFLSSFFLLILFWYYGYIYIIFIFVVVLVIVVVIAVFFSVVVGVCCVCCDCICSNHCGSAFCFDLTWWVNLRARNVIFILVGNYVPIVGIIEFKKKKIKTMRTRYIKQGPGNVWTPVK